MTTPPPVPLRPTVAAALLLLAACQHDRDDAPQAGTGLSASEGSSATATLTDAPAADSTGAPHGPSCIDDYHGNQHQAAALDLLLDTTAVARIVLGDGLVDEPPEAGTDQLAVCSSSASDFFSLHVECPGYLVAELRTLEGGVPDLLLHDSSLPGAPPLEQLLGTWSSFFLKPLQRDVMPGPHLLEVRHSGGGPPQRYGLAVTVFPSSPCPS